MGIFTRKHQGDIGCGFLSQREIDSLLEGDLAAERLRSFRRHQGTGCGECLHLGEAIDHFQSAIEHGPMESERIRFGGTTRIVKAHLRRALERAHSEGTWGIGVGLSSSELEQMAGGRQTQPLDPSSGDDVVSPGQTGGGGAGVESKEGGPTLVDDEDLDQLDNDS